MTTTLRVKRRVTGAAGAPAALKGAEIAYNEVDGLFYVGFGDDGSGNATTIKVFAKDSFNPLAVIPPGGGTGQVLTKTGVGDYVMGWQSVAAGAAYTAAAGSGITITGSALAADFTVVAPLASPALTGTPTGPTAAAATNNTQLATTAFVQTAVANLINGAPGALDTLKELADAIGDNANYAASVTTALGLRLITTNNLSDLTNAATARGNLGLGSMATQAAGAVAITGGTIDGVTLDGGTF